MPMLELTLVFRDPSLLRLQIFGTVLLRALSSSISEISLKRIWVRYVKNTAVTSFLLLKLSLFVRNSTVSWNIKKEALLTLTRAAGGGGSSWTPVGGNWLQILWFNSESFVVSLSTRMPVHLAHIQVGQLHYSKFVTTSHSWTSKPIAALCCKTSQAETSSLNNIRISYSI
jgi:hypothetical protein